MYFKNVPLFNSSICKFLLEFFIYLRVTECFVNPFNPALIVQLLYFKKTLIKEILYYSIRDPCGPP